jgi:outer membrane protein assembly factor BamB
VADGKIFTLGVSGILSCWDADTHQLLWRKDEIKGVPRFHVSMSPIVVDGMVIVQLGGPGHGSTIAYNASSGLQKWKWDGEAPEYASPVLLTVAGTKQIVMLTEKSLVGLGAADGKLLWQSPFVSQARAYNSATPIIDGKMVIITGQGRGTKALKIEKKGDAFVATEVWSNPQIAAQFCTPVLRNGLLFGITGHGDLFCVDAKDGKTAWTSAANLGRYGAMINAGSVIMALPENGELIVFKPNAGKFEQLARIKAAATKTYALPVIAGKRIFVKDQESLAMKLIK